MTEVKKLYRYGSAPSETISCLFMQGAFATMDLTEYTVKKETRCGYWISDFGGRKKWVSKTSTKRFAHPTPEEALRAFVARKTAYVRHARRRLAEAEQALRTGQTLTVNPFADAIRVHAFKVGNEGMGT